MFVQQNHHGFSILELSKLVMCEFYKSIFHQYFEIRLMWHFMDTDSVNRSTN